MQNREYKRQPYIPAAIASGTFAQFVCAAAAGSISQVMFYPASTALTRMQVNTGAIRSLEDCKRVILGDAYKGSIRSKISSIYSGFMMAGTYKIATRTMKYGMQPPLANFLTRHYGTAARNYFGDMHGKALLEALAGGVIGVLEVLFFHSLDTIRIKRQSGDRTALSQLIRRDPLKLYNGACLTMARNFTSFSVLFGISSMLMSMMGLQNTREANLKQRFSAASVAAAASVIATNPLDVVKSRIQKAHERVSTVSMFRQVIQKEGPLAFYKGISIKILTSLPKKAVPLALTGYLLKLWETQRTDQPETKIHAKPGSAG